MLVIGLTGGIGTGKTEVSRILEELGAVIISADRMGHESYEPNSRTWKLLIAGFGDEIVGADGRIDRKALATIVFADSVARTTLNSIVHPEIARRATREIERLRALGVGTIVLEAALLFEAKWDYLVNEIWEVSATEELVLNRLKSRDGLSRLDVKRRVEAQTHQTQISRHRHIIIENTTTLKALRSHVESLWHSRQKEGIGKYG